jgi:Tfp pilus assembly protein PilF
MDKQTDFIVDKKGVVYDVRGSYYPKVENNNYINRKEWNVPGNKNLVIENNKTDKLAIILIPIVVVITLILALVGILGNVNYNENTDTNGPILSQSEYYNYSEACHLFLKGDYVMARFYIDMVIGSDTNNAQAYNISGLIYYKEKNYEKAITEFNTGLELEPNSTDILNNRGITYFALEKFEESILDFNQAISLTEHNAKAFYNRGLVFVAKKMYGEAIDDLSKAIEISSANPINQIKQTIAIEKRSTKMFVDIFEEMEFYQTDIDLAAAYYQRGLVYLIIGEEDKGNSDLAKALAMGFTLE